MIRFSDLLYGRIELPPWLAAFIRIPEFARLRGVRLSNVDSIDFKDFGSANRWEHGIGVAYLAWSCGQYRQLSIHQRAELTLAALLHDVATPPFAHTAESVLEGFSHELETQFVLTEIPTKSSSPDMPVFGSSLPQFHATVRKMRRETGIKVDPDEVARMIVGDGDLGFLISGTLDLDNADNVTRGCAQMGLEVDRLLPLRLARWLAEQETAPTELDTKPEADVQQWLAYRSRYYSEFYNSSEQELGRQAFLQHLMRRAVKAGLPRRALIWNTDEGLLNTIGGIQEINIGRGKASLAELVERYRLMERTQRIFEVELEDEESLRVLRSPASLSWLEETLGTNSLEVLALVSPRRYAKPDHTSLFPTFSCGSLIAFKLGDEIRYRQLPAWLKGRVPETRNVQRLRRLLTDLVRTEVPNWVNSRPWFVLNDKREESLIENLRSAGDWGFRLSKNENLHAYPGTYVHAIPATLINCLGLGGELILDPFGGTGQTACEATKYECSAITADSNSIATLVAQTRLTHLTFNQREWLRHISFDELFSIEPSPPPVFELVEKWHHPSTIVELSKIRTFITSVVDSALRQFLLMCFSAIITSSTARRGKQHGFFADNTPLPKDMEEPPYITSLQLFIAKVKKNVEIVNRFYSFLERTGRSPEKELKRIKVLKVDASIAQPEDYGIGAGSVGGIITSPPYLCMADYSLGQRLSYHWIAPEDFSLDFKIEIGARRLRSNPLQAAEKYFSALENFARNAAYLIKAGGFLAIVLGTPLAESFKDIKVIEKVDQILRNAGFDSLWSRDRPIHWHRNQGYQRLLKERVSVHVRR